MTTARKKEATPVKRDQSHLFSCHPCDNTRLPGAATPRPCHFAVWCCYLLFHAILVESQIPVRSVAGIENNSAECFVETAEGVFRARESGG